MIGIKILGVIALFVFLILSLVTSVQIRFLSKGKNTERRLRHLESHLYISLTSSVSLLFYFAVGYAEVLLFPLIYFLYHLLSENEELRKGVEYLDR